MKAIYFFENDDLIYSIDDRNYIGIDIYLPETNISEGIFIFKDFEDTEAILESNRIIIFTEDTNGSEISAIRYELIFNSIGLKYTYSYGKLYEFNNLKYNIFKKNIDKFIYNFDILDDQLNPNKLRKNKLDRL